MKSRGKNRAKILCNPVNSHYKEKKILKNQFKKRNTNLSEEFRNAESQQ